MRHLIEERLARQQASAQLEAELQGARYWRERCEAAFQLLGAIADAQGGTFEGVMYDRFRLNYRPEDVVVTTVEDKYNRAIRFRVTLERQPCSV